MRFDRIIMPRLTKPRKTPPTRVDRRRAIVTVLGSRTVRSQAELQAALESRGIAANQATLSRDLRELGVLKGQHGYELPHGERTQGGAAISANGNGASSGTADYRLAARSWLLTATAAENLVVLHTPTGGAQPLALALDNAAVPGLIGTIAGDDTVLAICRTKAKAQAFARRLNAEVTR